MLLNKRFSNDGKKEIYLNSIQENALFHFKEQLKNDRYIFESYDCDCGCSYDDLILIAEKDRYGIDVKTKICPKCGLLMTNPRMNQEGYNTFYDSLYRQLYVGRYKAGYEYFATQRERGDKILEYIKNNCDISKMGSMLEIGCSAGGIVSVFKEYGIPRCKGIDLGSEYIAYGIEMGQDLENCNSLELKRRGEKYDLIVLNHVFEHFLDIKTELDIIQELLTENGVLYIEVPGVMNIHNGYQGNFLKYLQNAHVRHFSHNTLCQILKWNGFDEICGDESVRGLFRQGNIGNEVVNYCNSILEYLKSMEEVLAKKEDVLHDYKTLAESRLRNIEILDRWLTLSRKGINWEACFKNMAISEVAIYGGGFLGEQLLTELNHSHIKVAYIIDKNKDIVMDDLTVYQPTDMLRKVDTIIIATSGDYFNIKQKIEQFAENVLTLPEILNKVEAQYIIEKL